MRSQVSRRQVTGDVPRKCWKLKEAAGDLGLEVRELSFRV